jgi:hypothetical protein
LLLLPHAATPTANNAVQLNIATRCVRVIKRPLPLLWVWVALQCAQRYGRLTCGSSVNRRNRDVGA